MSQHAQHSNVCRRNAGARAVGVPTRSAPFYSAPSSPTLPYILPLRLPAALPASSSQPIQPSSQTRRVLSCVRPLAPLRCGGAQQLPTQSCLRWGSSTGCWCRRRSFDCLTGVACASACCRAQHVRGGTRVKWDTPANCDNPPGARRQHHGAAQNRAAVCSSQCSSGRFTCKIML